MHRRSIWHGHFRHVSLDCRLHDGLTCRFEYNTDLFGRETIARAAEHFTRLLAAAIAAPDTSITRLPMLSPEERHQVLFAFNDTSRPDPALLLPIPTLFEQQAAHRPAAPALFAPADGLTLSYHDLNARANQLACALTTHHQLPPEAVEAVCLERSPEVIICLLALLKAGLTYLPIDPATPPQRLRFLLEDAAPACCSPARTPPSASARCPARCSPCPPMQSGPGGSARGQPAPASLPHTPAYLLYTSGSTGTPKGVLVEQGACSTTTWPSRACSSCAPPTACCRSPPWPSTPPGGDPAHPASPAPHWCCVPTAPCPIPPCCAPGSPSGAEHPGPDHRLLARPGR